MEEQLASQIREFSASQQRPIPFSPAAAGDVAEAESQLGFSIPPLLKAVYLRVGNGGFGPGRGGNIIGLNGGYTSDFGTLVETYRQLKNDCELDGKQWLTSLLPFCEWGCNIFTCVQCGAEPFLINSFEEGEVSPTGYTLQSFFRLWLEGTDILSYNSVIDSTAEGINPFTGEKKQIKRRRSK
jgi:hypothetical protein